MARRRRRKNPEQKQPVLLPTQANIIRSLNGDGKAWPFTVRDYVGRAVIIGLGLYGAGVRDPKDLVKYAFAAAGAVDVFVVLHTIRYNRGIDLATVDGAVIQPARRP